MASTEQDASAPSRSKKTPPSKRKEEGTEKKTPLAPSASQGLMDLITPTSDEEPGRIAETLQRSQLDSRSRVDKVKETKRKSPPSPVRTCRYALEVRILVESSPGVYSPPEDESYSADFVQDNLNLAYPGCTRVFLAEPGSLIAFYGKKGASQAGLSVEQGMEACQIIGNITSWMGHVASVKVKAISLAEADDMVRGMKRLEKESLRKARLDLCQKLSALQLGQNTTLSVSAKPFVPLATSSQMGINGSGTNRSGTQGTIPNPPPLPFPTPPHRLSGTGVPRRPLVSSSSEDEETTTDGTTTDSSIIPTKKGSHKRGKRGKRKKKGSQSETGESGSEANSIVASGRSGRKKAGVTNKINIPEFTGTADKPGKVAEDFRRWARVITFYRDYYEDEFLMSQIIGVLKEDAADVFDFSRKRGGGTKDLGVILQRMRNHYCDTLTFREQRNSVENMKQGTQESAPDFLVRVSGAVESLARDFKGTIPKEEFNTLLYDVSFNGVNEDVRHVLDSVMARHGELDVDRMYDAVKTHEAYVAWNKCLGNRAPGAGTPSTQASAPLGGHFKPRFQRPTVWVAVAVEDLGPTPEGVEYSDEEGEDSSTKDSSNDSGGLYIPDFLKEAPDGNWGLNVRMAQAIKADEAQRKKCFICQSPDHFIRDCPVAKNGRRPLQPRGPLKNNPAPATPKARTPSSLPGAQEQVAHLPAPQPNAPGK